MTHPDLSNERMNFIYRILAIILGGIYPEAMFILY